MATKKISELEAINAAEDNDVLVIVDTSESTTNKITKGNLLIGAGHTIEMTLNENYQIVLILKNAAGTALSTQTIDLPNENAVTNLAYNNGILTITKQSGATSQINLTGLIEGLVTENDFNTFKEALQTTLEAINEKDAEQDEAIAENYKVINKLNEKLENQQKVISQLPQVEGQGTSITLENTIEAQFTKFDVEGNSEQESTEGKNKLSFTENTISYAGVTTNISETKMKFNGKMASVTNIFNTIREDKAVPAGTYKLSYTKLSGSTSGSGDWAVYFNFYNANGTRIANNNFASNESGTAKDLVLSEDVAYYNYYAYCNSTSLEFNNLELGFMIEPGTTATNYEPYTGGIASPNPNYEQPIKSAGDNENIFDKDNEEQFLQNLTPDNNGLIVSAQTSTTSPNYIRTIIIPCKSDANYAITRFLGGKTFFIYESDEYPTLNKQTTLLKRNNDAGKASEIIKTSATAKYLLVKIYNTYASEYYSYDELISSIKIEKGNKATLYSPYGMGSINEKISNKNWFNKNSNFKTYVATVTPIDTGIKVENNDGGTYRSVWCEIGKDELLGKTLTIQTSISTYNGAIPRIIVVFNNKTAQYIEQIKTIITSTEGTLVNIPNSFPENADRVSLIFYCSFTSATPKGSYVEYKDFQVELGSTATPYVEHKEQDYSIFVQQPMMDDDHFDRKNNKEVHTWIKYVLDGSNDENWSIRNNKFFINDNVNYNSWERVISPNGKSNIGVVSYSVLDNQTGFGLALAYGIRLNLENINAASGGTVEQLRTYLAEHPITIYVKLKEGAYEKLPCTETQIQQLENKPSTYKDFTTINSQDETPAYLEVSGIRDIDTMFDKVTNAIVSLGGNV